MSQHYFNTAVAGEPVTVTMGWDRPLQGYFMMIESAGREQYLYNNLEDLALIPEGGFADSLDYFIEKMKELGVTVPDRMLNEIRVDGGLNVGNRHVAYGVDGTILWER